MSHKTAFPGELPQELSTDDVYDLLADQHRRQVLLALHRRNGPRQLPSLATDVAGVSEPTRTVERLYLRLYHVHVPKLEDRGVVTYDDESDLVELTERGKSLAAALDR